MVKTHTSNRNGWLAWLTKPLHWLMLVLSVLFRVGLITWASLALYWSNLPSPGMRLVLAITFALFGIWTLFISRHKQSAIRFAVAFLLVLIWWLLIPASQYRDWRREVAVLPHAVIEGNRILLINVRNFDYRTRNDFTVRYENREVLLSHLTGVDFLLSFWMTGPIGHTWLSFTFDNAPPVSISIETRPEKGETFNPLSSMFKQFELIYVVGDEHDLIGVRASHRNEEVFLYHVQVTPQDARKLFLVYLARINQLSERPEWYNLLSNNCTLNIVRYMNRAGRQGGFRPSHLLNGVFDGYLYNTGYLDTSLPMAELRERSRITDAAKAAAHDADFSTRIRVGLPGLPAASLP